MPMSDEDMWTRACSEVRRDLDVGPVDDGATIGDLPNNDADFWDRVEARVKVLRATGA